MSTATSLYTKLADVAAEVTRVDKDGFNDYHKYKYTSAEAMLTAIRGPLTARNVVLMPSLADVTEREITTAKGGASTITTVHVDFTFVDGDSGETHKCSWAGQGDDPADKGLGKAYTNAIKTFLREAFLLPMGDDPEADVATDRRAAGRQPSAPGKPSDAQLKFLRSLVKKHDPPAATLNTMLERVGAGHLVGVAKWTPALNRQQVSQLIEIFKEGVLPTGESDIPSDVGLPDTPQDGPPTDTSDVPWDELPSKAEAQQMLADAQAKGQTP
jgi:hypothetical protein